MNLSSEQVISFLERNPSTRSSMIYYENDFSDFLQKLKINFNLIIFEENDHPELMNYHSLESKHWVETLFIIKGFPYNPKYNSFWKQYIDTIDTKHIIFLIEKSHKINSASWFLRNRCIHLELNT